MSDVPSRLPDAGDMIAGRYRLNHRLAAGGMAAVWQGTDTVLEREVAVKILHPHLAADDTFVARFRAEAVSVARLRHPNIVAIYDTCTADGLEAIVMELVRGRNLRVYLDEHGPLHPAEAVHIVAEAADALAAAHRAGLVHRDVKPANILIRDDGQVLVTDFGIAKMRSQTADLTQVGMMIGSVRYLSPEQVEGREVDPRSDVYSLGIVLYEALTGRVPFQGDTDAATALARLREAPPRPRQLRPGISKGLEAVVLRALALDPGQRFSSAVELRAALLAAPTEDPGGDATGIVIQPSAPAARPPAAAPASFAQSERRWLIPTVLIVIIATALGLAGVLFGQTQAGQDLLDQVRGEPADGSDGDEPPATTPEGAALSGVTAVAFDPLGTEGEHDADAPKAVDGDPATVWATEEYTTRDLGGGKPGVGLLLDLGASTALRTLAVTSPSSGWNASVFVGDDPAAWQAGPTGAPAGQVENAPGDVVIELDGTAGRYALLWITLLTEAAPHVVVVAEAAPGG